MGKKLKKFSFDQKCLNQANGFKKLFPVNFYEKIYEQKKL